MSEPTSCTSHLHGRSFRQAQRPSDADEVLITIIYLRQVCTQKVLCDLPGGFDRLADGDRVDSKQLHDEQKISITPTVVRCFTRADDQRAWATRADPDAGSPSRATPLRTRTFRRARPATY